MPLDIGVGLILGVFLSNTTEVSLFLSLLIGVSATLLPDIDFIWSYLRSRKLPESDHRDGLHYPLLVIPIIGLLGTIIDPAFGIVFALGSVAHFIHDSVGIGFGIKWLYPFKKNSYLFLFQIKTPNNHNMPKKLLYSWNDEERKEAISMYGYSAWIKYVYFRPNIYGAFEYSGLLVGVVIVILSI